MISAFIPASAYGLSPPNRDASRKDAAGVAADGGYTDQSHLHRMGLARTAELSRSAAQARCRPRGRPSGAQAADRISSAFSARTVNSRLVSTTMVRPVLGRMISEAAKPGPAPACNRLRPVSLKLCPRIRVRPTPPSATLARPQSTSGGPGYPSSSAAYGRPWPVRPRASC